MSKNFHSVYSVRSCSKFFKVEVFRFSSLAVSKVTTTKVQNILKNCLHQIFTSKSFLMGEDYFKKIDKNANMAILSFTIN